jgi:hypothetical protein
VCSHYAELRTEKGYEIQAYKCEDSDKVPCVAGKTQLS